MSVHFPLLTLGLVFTAAGVALNGADLPGGVLLASLLSAVGGNLFTDGLKPMLEAPVGEQTSPKEQLQRLAETAWQETLVQLRTDCESYEGEALAALFTQLHAVTTSIAEGMVVGPCKAVSLEEALASTIQQTDPALSGDAQTFIQTQLPLRFREHVQAELALQPSAYALFKLRLLETVLQQLNMLKDTVNAPAWLPTLHHRLEEQQAELLRQFPELAAEIKEVKAHVEVLAGQMAVLDHKVQTSADANLAAHARTQENTALIPMVEEKLNRLHKAHVQQEKAQQEAADAAQQQRQQQLKRILTAGYEDSRPGLTPTQLLQARFALVPFDKALRARERRQLDAWLSSSAPFAIQLVTGDAGTGKTRLLYEMLAEAQTEGWVAGMLRDPFRSPEAIQKDLEDCLRGPEPLLIGIDYAESLRTLLDVLGVLSNDDSSSERKVRVLLTARGTGDWWTNLPSHSPHRNVERALEACQPLELTPLGDAAPKDTAQNLYAAAVQAFARYRGKTPVSKSPSELEGYDTPLRVVLAALADVEGVQHTASNLLEALVKHEERFWLTVLPIGFKRDKAARLLRQVMGAITLRGGLQTEEDHDALHERLKLETVHDLEEVKGLLRRLYGTGVLKPWLNPIQPDLLGAELVRRCLSEDMTLLETTLADNDADSLATAFRLLEDIGQESPALCGSALDTLLAQDIEARALPALLAATRWKGKSRTHLIADRLLVRLKSGIGFELLDQLHNALPLQSLALAELALWVTDEILKRPNLSAEVTAELLLNKGHRLSELGRREEALQATQEAVGLYRRLVEQNPDAFNPNLAMSLNNLGNMLSNIGRREEALKATEEALGLYRPLAEKNPDAFNPYLATSLNNLGTPLSELGRREEALQATQEAVGLYRRLAEKNPDAFNPDLAMSLNNLGIRLSALGRREGALQATQEAVGLYQKLAE
ncbi:MAG: tetratricopeptide repeat protein, partial [Myxococcota bacterium]